MRQPYAYVAHESHLRDLKWTTFICGLLLMSRSPQILDFLPLLEAKAIIAF